MEEELKTILLLFKQDLGVVNDRKDTYFTALIKAAITEITERGIPLDLKQTEDAMLLSDYAVWKYRNRQNNEALSQNLKWRLMARKTKERAK